MPNRNLAHLMLKDLFTNDVKLPLLFEMSLPRWHNNVPAEETCTVMKKGRLDVLFQLPPNLTYSDSNFDNILSAIDGAFTNVIEFRHESWWNEKVYKTLREKKVTFCSISYPSLPDEVIRSVPVMYYRFHGVPQLYVSPYSTQKMKKVTDNINAFRGIRDVYVYFNNDVYVEAIRNARELAGIVT